MSKFCFTLLDTMGYIQEVTITKDAVSCTGPSSSGFCSHSTWCLHKIFHFSKEEDFIFKKNFNNSEWGQIIKAFPERVPLVRLPKCKEEFFDNVRQSQKDANSLADMLQLPGQWEIVFCYAGKDMEENSKYKVKINLRLSKRHTNTGHQHRYKIKVHKCESAKQLHLVIYKY